MAVNDPGQQPEPSAEERRAMATLAEAVDSAERDTVLTRLRFWFFYAWRARLMISSGLVLAVASFLAIWEEMSYHLPYAVAAEGVLTGAGLLVGYGVRRWRLQRRPDLALRAGDDPPATARH